MNSEFEINITQILATNVTTSEINGAVEVVKVESSKKQKIILFRTKNEQQTFAYRILTTPNKIEEYSKIVSLQDQLSFLPRVYYFDLAKGEAITQWTDGEQLGYFDGREQPPPPTNTEIKEIASVLVDMHSHRSSQFNAVEEEPAIERITVDLESLSPNANYFDVLVRNYDQVFPHMENGKRKANLDPEILTEIEYLVGKGKEFLLRSQSLFESLSTFSLVHGDVHPENIIRTTDKKIKLIDYEHLHYGDPAWELSFFLEQGSQARFIDTEKREEFLETYIGRMHHVDPLWEDPSFKDRVKAYNVYVVLKFLGLICDGLASGDPVNEVNIELLSDVLSRARQLQL